MSVFSSLLQLFLMFLIYLHLYPIFKICIFVLYICTSYLNLACYIWISQSGTLNLPFCTKDALQIKLLCLALPCLTSV